MSNLKLKNEILMIEEEVKEKQFELISKIYGEPDLYSFTSGEVRFYCNPYMNDVWNILDCLDVIEGIMSIKVEFASNRDDEYDTVIIYWG